MGLTCCTAALDLRLVSFTKTFESSIQARYHGIVRTMRAIHDGHCAVACTASIIGTKWTPLLVHDLSEGPRRFSELERACPGISPRTLSERLDTLEGLNILERQSYPESPPRVEYTLTETGEALLPIIAAMSAFGHDWLGCDHAHPDPSPLRQAVSTLSLSDC